jgi:hypothetical protein
LARLIDSIFVHHQYKFLTPLKHYTDLPLSVIITCPNAIQRGALDRLKEYYFITKGKGEVVPVLNLAPGHEGVWGSWGIALRILDTDTRWRWVVSFTPGSLYPQGKSSWHSLDRRLGGPQSRSGHGGEEKNSQPLSELKPPIIQPVAQRYTTELTRLIITLYYDTKNNYSISLHFILKAASICLSVMLCYVEENKKNTCLFLFVVLSFWIFRLSYPVNCRHRNLTTVSAITVRISDLWILTSVVIYDKQTTSRRMDG